MPRLLLLLIVLSTRTPAQTNTPVADFSITLERIGCLGSCPDYKVTVHGNGSVEYDGRFYVRTEGLRKKMIQPSAVQKLVRKLQDEDFLHWEEKDTVCLDFPEVHITATLNGQHKHVLEGCNTPGKVLQLADEIDKISGSRGWVGKGH